MLLAALQWGEWAHFEQSLRSALSRESVAANGSGASDQELRPGVIAFRRARGLISGDDYRAWLAERHLTIDDVHAHVRRGLTTHGGTPTAADCSSAEPIDEAELAAAASLELYLGGRLRSWAEQLARRAAAVRGLVTGGHAVPPAPDPDVAALIDLAQASRTAGLDAVDPGLLAAGARRTVELEVAFAEFAAGVATAERVDACLAGHRLDWQRLRWEQSVFATEGAAREAALWVREEGMALQQITERAGGTWTTEGAYSDQVAQLARATLGAEVGQLIGPFELDGDWVLLLLHERSVPSREDPALANRAEAEVLEDALQRHLAGRVQWHGHL